MATPDFKFSPKDGEETSITIGARAKPWWVQISGHNLYVTVECDEEPPNDDPGPEAEVDAIGGEPYAL